MIQKISLRFLFGMLFLPALMMAQPFNMDTSIHPTEIKLHSFKPKGEPSKNGKLGIALITQVKDTAYFFCKGLSIYSPVIAQVFKKDPSENLAVQLHKWNWKEAGRKGMTDVKGLWQEQLRTENDFGIMIINKGKPAVYNLFIWVGDEMKVKLPSLFVSYEEYEKKGEEVPKDINTRKTKNKSWMYFLAGGLIIAVVVVFLKRKNTRKGTMFLLLFTLFNVHYGQDLNRMIEEELADFDVNADGRFPLEPNDFVTQPGDNDFVTLEQAWSQLQSNIVRLNSGLSNLNTALNVLSAAMDAADLYNAYTTFDEQECTPDFSQDAGAMMPASCINSNSCNECFNEAYDKLDGNRRSLAKMWCIYNNTRSFKDKAISTGNNIASLPGGVGFGWQAARRDIERAYENFKHHYDNKYQQFMQAVHDALVKISVCEEQFGMRDWYRRFGFMYFELIQQKYKRTD